MDEHEKSTLRFGEQGESRLVGQRESAHLFLDRNCGEDRQVQAARRSSALCNFGVPADIVLALPEPIRLRL
jgi:hypothetical protein